MPSTPSSAGRSELLGDDALVHLRDVYDHVVRAVELGEAHRDLLNGALDAHLSLVSNRMNLVMKRATSSGAILVLRHVRGRRVRHELQGHARNSTGASATRWLSVSWC